MLQNIGGKGLDKAQKQEDTLVMAKKRSIPEAFVRTGTGPIRQRKSGAGVHDPRPNRQRTRGQIRSAALHDWTMDPRIENFKEGY